MGQLIDFDRRAVATLRRRVAEVEGANQDLIAFARGHSGAVSAIHEAVLAAADADALDDLIHVVTRVWPQILGLDAVALALFSGNTAIRADADGVQFVDRRMIERSAEGLESVVLRGVARGHPMFGPASGLIRAEAVIRLDGTPPSPSGLLALGQRRAQSFDTRHGSELLDFLGRITARMIGRWLSP